MNDQFIRELKKQNGDLLGQLAEANAAIEMLKKEITTLKDEYRQSLVGESNVPPQRCMAHT